eukprot:gene9047-12200_t
MYIQEILIDGFKSYANRTIVSQLDPSFNAITGMNGTGKSNILDSICFVLGISNLSQVRAENLQELVYKQGQAGVTKASVSIIFNNSDIAGSPVGYESHKQITVTRQVVIGGKNKYIINGHTAQREQVKNLFHSVQLNVDNPHFLIQQGRITKVLNMKPVETLAMIEEAAGTRMFETKKQQAIKTIAKKQEKVDEITRCIDNEITPTLDNLRSQRQDYHAWLSNNTEFERIDRLCIAYEFNNESKAVQSSQDLSQSLANEQNQLIQSVEVQHHKIEELNAKIEVIEATRTTDGENGLSFLKNIESEKSKVLVKTSALHTNKLEAIQTEQESVTALKNQINVAKVNLGKKNEELQLCMNQLELKEVEALSTENTHNQLRETYQNAVAGVTDVSNAELLSIPEQVGAWEKKERETLSLLNQNQQKIDYNKSSLKDLKKTLKSQPDTDKVTKEMNSIQQAIAGLESNLSSMRYKESDEIDLRKKAVDLRQVTSQLQNDINKLTASLEARLSFEFRDPVRGFDRSKVKGLVARLIKVSDKSVTTALEITAGAKLYQVVVDNEQTGKMLLQNGELKKRVTILPLNKINNRCLENDKIQRAGTIAKRMGGTAKLALELVGYDEEVKRAIEHVFGTTIICNTSEIAKNITFDQTIKARTVTLDGDILEPSGTLTGGSNSQFGVLLSQIEDLSVAHSSFDRFCTELKEIEKELSIIEKEVLQSKDLQNNIELKKQALRICEDKLADSSYTQTLNRINELEEEIIKLDQENKDLKEQNKKAKEELNKLQSVQTNVKQKRENAMKEMENEVRKCSKQLRVIQNDVLNLRNKRDSLNEEVKTLTLELGTLHEQFTSIEQNIVKLNNELIVLDNEVNKLKSEYEESKKAVLAKKQELNKTSKEIELLEKEKNNCANIAKNASLESRKITMKMNEVESNTKQSQSRLIDLMKKYPWIDREKNYFGQSGSDFDFTGKDIDQCVVRRKELKSEIDRLAKKVNKQVMGLIEGAESEFNELNRKRQVILNDKSKIEAVIEELDIKKAQALQTTWVKVNRDFGSIFSTLLPGTHAKLEPPEGCNVSDGLEVRVAFNGVWKDSLTELSGGQRSLLTLSLILSLLLFKPAPMYILDEVDSALDLSHTQNIGMMLRTHFSSSQFIVVSLKEGMFNNANVIFRTKFVDGVSAVTRTVAGGNHNKGLKGSSNNIIVSDHIEDEEEKILAPQKKKGKNNNNTTNNKNKFIPTGIEN